MPQLISDERFMRRALSVGVRGLGQVWPNPSVGCVLVRDGQIIGEGVTSTGGRPHGEVNALRAAGARAQGATAYVTLEPCTHTGKSGPCTSALIEAKVSRVVFAVEDEDLRVAGSARALLEAAGIEVSSGILEEEAQQAHAGFFKAKKLGLPFVTLKLATSIDGKIATLTGQSQWITGPEARRHVHSMRAIHDAVLVGGGTARSDDPSLNVRDLAVSKQPVRVIASAGLDIPLTGKLALTAHETPVWLCHSAAASDYLKEAWLGLGAKLIEVEAGADRQLSARSMMECLAEEGLTRIYCEGGGRLAASLVADHLVDDVVTYTAGVIIGGDGHSAIAPIGLRNLSEATRLKLKDVRAIDGDVMHHWSVV